MTRWDHGGKTTTERGLGWEWQKARKQALIRDGYLCQTCLMLGKVTPADQVDHIIPRSKGGTHAQENLSSICGPCHDLKNARDEGRTIKQRIGADGWPE